MFEDEDYEREMADRTLLSRLLSIVWNYRNRFILSVAVVSSGSVLGVIQPLLLKMAIDQYLTPAAEGAVDPSVAFVGLLWIGGGYVALAVSSYFLSFARTYLMNWIGHSVMRDLRNRMFGHLQKMSRSFYDKSEIGTLMSKVTSDVETMYEVLATGIVERISDFLRLGLILIVMFTINVRLTLYCLVTIPLLLAVALGFKEIARRAYRRTRTKIAGVMSNLQESISGVRVAQSFSREDKNAEEFDQANVENLKANVYAAQVFSVFFPLISIVGSIGMAILYYFGAQAVISNEITLGVLVAFTAYVMQFFHPIMGLTMFYNSLQSAFAASERIFTLLDNDPDVVEKKGAIRIEEIKGVLDFEDVTFGYVPGQNVLENFNLHVEEGERLAIVGPTGAGKSTVMNLIVRFYDVDSGKVKVDGHDLRDLCLDTLRNNMAIVLQDTVLFSGTIRDNIRFGRPEASDAEVEEAAKMVGAHEFIERLPAGYDTMVRERGSNLSVGQRQLVSFARALLVNPPILLLDEATSSVDPYTELVIQTALEKLLENRTSVVIAHRLSTVRNADRIVVMDEGKIVEEGSHEELISRDGMYRRLCEMQLMARQEQSTPESSGS
jgi:ATP-binding cassette subfamily B protein